MLNLPIGAGVGDYHPVHVDVKPLDSKLGGDAHAVDVGLTFCHVVCCAKM
jgi:hypothetical protein